MIQWNVSIGIVINEWNRLFGFYFLPFVSFALGLHYQLYIFLFISFLWPLHCVFFVFCGWKFAESFSQIRFADFVSMCISIIPNQTKQNEIENARTWLCIFQITGPPLWARQIAQCENLTDNDYIRINTKINADKTSSFHVRIHMWVEL